MKEIWKNVSELEGFEPYDKYFISNFGRIKSLHRGKEIFRKTPNNGHGYPRVDLYSGTSKGKTVVIHKLVALAFVKNSNPLVNVVINHIDTNKENPKYDNMEWTTQQDNYRKYLVSEYAEAFKKRMSDTKKISMLGEGNHFYGKKHTKESKQKISDSLKKYNQKIA